MKNILVKSYLSGEYAHATKIWNQISRLHYIEVRPLDRYDEIHTCTIPSFYLYYEVLVLDGDSCG